MRRLAVVTTLSFVGMVGGCLLPELGVLGGGSAGDAALDVLAHPDGAPDVGPEAGGGCPPAPAFCDDFERTKALPDPRWESTGCDPPGALSVGGTLKVSYPALSGASGVRCLLGTSKSSAPLRAFQLAMDMKVTSVGGPFIDLWTVAIEAPTPRSDGLQSLLYQILVNGAGDAQLVVVGYYPDASKSPVVGINYPAWSVAAASAFVAPLKTCRVEVSVDPAIGSYVGKSTCNGSTSTLSPQNNKPPSPLVGAYSLDVGYALTVTGSAVPPWVVEFDNLKFVPSF